MEQMRRSFHGRTNRSEFSTGFTGTVSFACMGAPTADKCAVSPTSLNITNANAAPFSVSIQTAGSAGTSFFLQSRPNNWLIFLAIIAWFALFLFFWMSKTRNRVARASAYIAASALFVVLVSAGCGGGSTTQKPPPPQITPKGNYTITVSATANNLPAQTISLTLTVN